MTVKGPHSVYMLMAVAGPRSGSGMNRHSTYSRACIIVVFPDKSRLQLVIYMHGEHIRGAGMTSYYGLTVGVRHYVEAFPACTSLGWVHT